MTDVQETEPTTDAPEPAPVPEVAPEAETAEAVAPEGQEPAPETPELDQPTAEPTEPDTVEVEINGLKYLVPKGVERHVMLDADYTRKSQDTAEKVRALEGERTTLEEARKMFAQQAQTQQEHIQDYGELAHTDKLLESFRKVDFQQLQQNDPDQAQQLGFQFQMLRDGRQQIVERIQKREYDARVEAERERSKVTQQHANRRDQLTATLARDIPNYSPELQGKMNETAIRAGFSKAEIDSVTDPKLMQILHLAHLGEQVLQRKRAATAKPAPTPVKPVPKVVSGTSPKPGVRDDLPIEEWMRRERQRMDKR